MHHQRQRVHLITGGFPVGSTAGHDMDFARLEILQSIRNLSGAHCTVSSDYGDLAKWLRGADFLITYVAGPYPQGDDNDALQAWLAEGGKWFALHGSSGGKAERTTSAPRPKRMVKMAHHDTLGSFFLNHPPIRKFEVNVASDSHPLLKDVPPRFDIVDELYLVEMLDPKAQILMTTSLPKDPSPEGFGFVYDEDTSLQPDGETRVIGYAREVGAGAVAYVALGHCHSPDSNSQPFVDDSASAGGTTPPVHLGAWETPAFRQLLENAVRWGLDG
ncbi:MAG: ThuA domain-containing protein [Gammaproteobacteria bacterium]|nr:ThuA domain-containing protein [Gammaproteobacteria bacterium]